MSLAFTVLQKLFCIWAYCHLSQQTLCEGKTQLNFLFCILSNVSSMCEIFTVHW